MQSIYHEELKSPCNEQTTDICGRLEELNYELDDLVKERDGNKLTMRQLRKDSSTSREKISDVKNHIHDINDVIKSYEPEMIALQSKLSTIMKKIKKEGPYNEDLNKTPNSIRKNSYKKYDSKVGLDPKKFYDSKNK